MSRLPRRLAALLTLALAAALVLTLPSLTQAAGSMADLAPLASPTAPVSETSPEDPPDERMDDLEAAHARAADAASVHETPAALADVIEAAASGAAEVPLDGLAEAVAAALTEDDKLTAADGAQGDEFGYSVSLSGDRALVGAYLDDDNGSSSGSAYVFAFDGASWAQEAKLTAADGAVGAGFGVSVSLSGDRALVGASGDGYSPGEGDRIFPGSAYVFAFDGASWTQEAKLTAADGASDDDFGYSVSLSGDRALIGAYRDDDDGSFSGSAYVFAFDGASWAQEAKLTASDGAWGDSFGLSVSLSGDRALVGAYGDDDDGSVSGSAYVFAFDGASWAQEAKLTAADGAADDQFGGSVSLSGGRALVGAIGDDDNGSVSGSAYVFAFDGTSWAQEAKLAAADGAVGAGFGSSVSLSGDRALVGAYRDGFSGTGSAYVFAFDGASWAQEAKLTASDGTAQDLFGSSVSLSGDRALVGAVWDRDNGLNSGSAYTFGLTACEPGAFSGTGSAPCTPAPPGFFVAEAGATEATPAPPGFFVDQEGAVQATACALGTYQPDAGQTSCLPAPVGFYVDVTGAAAATACPAGQTTPGEGSANADACFALNGPPAITAVQVPAGPVAVGADAAVTAPFTDPDTGDTHTCAIDYGDGTTEAGTVDGLTCTGTHAYAEAGIYTVTVTVTDAAGEADTEAATDFVVVYDPSAGFVTGAGWIDSPEGAYAPAYAATGRASFGFVAKYKRGQSAPDGNTQFQFRAAGLSFESTAYEWLVVAGTRAKFKGVGTVDGAGDYGFMLTATDGDPDLFRIKIWDRANGDAVFYDNQLGAGDDSDAGTALGGGQVVLHDGKVARGPSASGALRAEPAAFGLDAPYPNPTGGTARVRFALDEAGPVRLSVYDALGREVAVLVDRTVEPGRHEAVLDRSDLGAGTYLVRLTAGSQTATQRLTLLR